MLALTMENQLQKFNPNILCPDYLIMNRLRKALIKYIPNMTGRVLDFGCGCKPYKEFFCVDDYIGLDIQNEAHPHLNEDIDIIYDPNSSFPLADNEFDSVFSTEVFEHVFNLEHVLRELRRVLKINGMLLISTPFCIAEHEQPNDFARYSSFGLKSLLERNGFQIIQQEKIGTSIETIIQIYLMHLHLDVLGKLPRIPLIKKFIRLFTYLFFNTLANVIHKVWPTGNDLYMNNIVIAKLINK